MIFLKYAIVVLVALAVSAAEFGLFYVQGLAQRRKNAIYRRLMIVVLGLGFWAGLMLGAPICDFLGIQDSNSRLYFFCFWSVPVLLGMGFGAYYVLCVMKPFAHRGLCHECGFVNEKEVRVCGRCGHKMPKEK